MDGIERELAGQVPVIRLSLPSDVGRQAAARYGVRAVPTFIILGPEGSEALRHVGLPNKERLVEAALALVP